MPTRSSNKVILEDSNRPNRIVQINVLHGIYSAWIEIYDAGHFNNAKNSWNNWDESNKCELSFYF